MNLPKYTCKKKKKSSEEKGREIENRKPFQNSFLKNLHLSCCVIGDRTYFVRVLYLAAPKKKTLLRDIGIGLTIGACIALVGLVAYTAAPNTLGATMMRTSTPSRTQVFNKVPPRLASPRP